MYGHLRTLLRDFLLTNVIVLTAVEDSIIILLRNVSIMFS